MAIDSTQVEGQIDSNLTDNFARDNKASVIRAILKIVVRWVRDAINGNLSTWLRVSDGQPGGINSEAVYHTGKAIFGRTTDDGSGAAIQANNASLMFVNGLSLNRIISINTGSIQYIKIATLPTGSSYGILRFSLHISTDVVANYSEIETYTLWNRSVGGTAGEQFFYTQEFGIDKAYKRAYVVASRRTTGEIDIYLKTNGTTYLCVNFLFRLESTIETTFTPISSLPGTDTVLFSSENTDPLFWNGNDGSIIAKGGATLGGDVTVGTAAVPKSVTSYSTFKSYFGSVLRAWKLGGATTSAGLTLKTTQYITVEIDGTSYKLALVN